MSAKIPASTIDRLSVYLRVAEQLRQAKMKTVSSSQLAEHSGVNSAQVRKDLAYFGQFGKRGEGYRTTSLLKNLKKILGVNRNWDVVLVGVGNLGSALLAYPGFKKEGFRICAAFDNNLLKIGKRLEEVQIQDIEKIEEFLKREKIRIGIIATPAEEAQSIADKLIKGGVKAILNFAPAALNVSEDIKVKNVDLSRELEMLSYFLAKKKKAA
ncbi:MAG TPA: redox-sensing transcriptional repressor Rex [Candidatus Omnitrophica bacterium]|nr:redox-sensing transcriptional repressor Rex [Candidatus Omnitrophota bacterium]